MRSCKILQIDLLFIVLVCYNATFGDFMDTGTKIQLFLAMVYITCAIVNGYYFSRALNKRYRTDGYLRLGDVVLSVLLTLTPVSNLVLPFFKTLDFLSELYDRKIFKK